MTWKTHIIGGAQAGVLLSYVHGGSAVDSALIISASVVGSVLPDIDHTRSRLCRNDAFVGPVSHLLSKVTKHRGITHTVIGALVFAGLFYGLSVFRSEKDSLVAMFSAAAVFFGINTFAGALRPLSGWAAALTYAMGPEIARLISEHNIGFSLNKESALLCSMGIFAGCMMHVAYDAFNKGGVMLLFPFSRKSFRLMDIKTNTAGEIVFNVVQLFILAGVMSACYKDTGLFGFLSEIIGSLKSLA